MGGWPPEFTIAERFGWTLEYIGSLPNQTVLDLIAYMRLQNERASRKAG